MCCMCFTNAVCCGGFLGYGGSSVVVQQFVVSSDVADTGDIANAVLVSSSAAPAAADDVAVGGLLSSLVAQKEHLSNTKAALEKLLQENKALRQKEKELLAMMGEKNKQLKKLEKIKKKQELVGISKQVKSRNAKYACPHKRQRSRCKV